MAGQSTLQVGDMMTDIGRVKRMFDELKKLNPEKFTGGNDQLSGIIKELIPYGHNYDDTVQRVETYVKLCHSVYGNPFVKDDKQLVCYNCNVGIKDARGGCSGGGGGRQESDFPGKQGGSANHCFVPFSVKKKVHDERQEVERLRSSIETKRTQISDLTNRLSAEMNAKMSSDERNIENINVKIRPSTLQTKYQNLCTQEWLGAKEALDDASADDVDEEPKLFLLFRVLKESETITSQLVDRFTAQVTNMILNPCASGTSAAANAMSNEVTRQRQGHTQTTSMANELRPADSKEKNPLNNESMNALNQLLRAVSDDVNLKSLEQKTKDALMKIPDMPYNKSRFTNVSATKEVYNNCQNNRDLDKYIEECVRLTWMMALQKPKMEFNEKGVGEKYDDKLQEVQWGSQADPKKGVVGFFVHPVLYHGDKASSKGKVFLVAKPK